MADDSSFGARLALVRQRMAWGNVKEAADECGLPAESWRRWERDGRAPRDVVQIAAVISDKTGCDLGWLLAGSRLRGRGDTETSHTVASKPAVRPITLTTSRARRRPRDGRPVGRPAAPTGPDGSRRPVRIA